MEPTPAPEGPVPDDDPTPAPVLAYASKKKSSDIFEIQVDETVDIEPIFKSITKLEMLLQSRHDNYSQHAHVKTPALLHSALSAVDALKQSLTAVVKTNISLDLAPVALRFASWRTLIWIIRTLLRSMEVQAESLPIRPESESPLQGINRKIAMTGFATNMKSLVDDMTTLNDVFNFIQIISFQPDTVRSEEIEKQIQSSYILPFWYGFKAETQNFRTLINLLKSTVGGSYSDTNVVSKMISMGTRAVDGILTTFQNAKEQTRRSHNLIKKEASIELLTKMWNMAETGLPSLIVSIATKPFIKVAKTVFISVPATEKQRVGTDSIELLLLSARSLPFKVPKGGVLNANGDLTPLTRDVPLGSPQAEKSPELPSEGVEKNASTPAWRGDELILHFHGGGFVSGSPYTHEMYLREWAKANPSSLVVSVNYTKAPQAIYPQAVNQCFFAYQTLVEHGFLGFKPRKVILTGDSAGGNLVLAVTIKAIQLGIRVPDSLLVAYPATDLRRSITVSRFLFGHDVLLPYDLIVVALEAYAPADQCDAAGDPLVSPLVAPDAILSQFPNQMMFMSASMDPLLDDCSSFLMRLRAVGKSPRWIMAHLPHGYWNMGAVLPSARTAINMSIEYLQHIINS